jgi:hypothetical protein
MMRWRRMSDTSGNSSFVRAHIERMEHRQLLKIVSTNERKNKNVRTRAEMLGMCQKQNGVLRFPMVAKARHEIADITVLEQRTRIGAMHLPSPLSTNDKSGADRAQPLIPQLLTRNRLRCMRSMRPMRIRATLLAHRPRFGGLHT